ncbi:hypothetical protein E4U46_004675 [Claviceps purpurea]|nr:hypothetical protein E4U46_004675 [Claviceps purpurea]
MTFTIWYRSHVIRVVELLGVIHSTLKRWLDNYSENDICTLVKKMLNWLESGHDQYEELASRHVASKPTNLLNDFSPA